MKQFLVFLSFQNEKTKQFINNHLFATNGQRQRKEGWGRRDRGKGLCSLFRQKLTDRLTCTFVFIFVFDRTQNKNRFHSAFAPFLGTCLIR